MRTFTLDIRIPEDVEDLTEETLHRISMAALSQGVSADVAVTLLLLATEGLIAGRIKEALAEAVPGMPEDMLETYASLNARLAVVDEVMHLPTSRPSITTSEM